MDVYDTATSIVCAAIRENFNLARDALIDAEKTFSDFDADELDIVEVLMMVEDHAITLGFMLELAIDDVSATSTIRDLINMVAAVMTGYLDPEGSWSACKKQMDAIEEHMVILRTRLCRLLTKKRNTDDVSWLKITAEALESTAITIRKINVPAPPWLTSEARDTFKSVPEASGPGV